MTTPIHNCCHQGVCRSRRWLLHATVTPPHHQAHPPALRSKLSPELRLLCLELAALLLRLCCQCIQLALVVLKGCQHLLCSRRQVCRAVAHGTMDHLEVTVLLILITGGLTQQHSMAFSTAQSDCDKFRHKGNLGLWHSPLQHNIWANCKRTKRQPAIIETGEANTCRTTRSCQHCVKEPQHVLHLTVTREASASHSREISSTGVSSGSWCCSPAGVPTCRVLWLWAAPLPAALPSAARPSPAWRSCPHQHPGHTYNHTSAPYIM